MVMCVHHKDEDIPAEIPKRFSKNKMAWMTP
jgi:hypothetical protein